MILKLVFNFPSIARPNGRPNELVSSNFDEQHLIYWLIDRSLFSKYDCYTTDLKFLAAD